MNVKNVSLDNKQKKLMASCNKAFSKYVDCRTCEKFRPRTGECASVGKCTEEFFMYVELPKIQLFITGDNKNEKTN